MTNLFAITLPTTSLHIVWVVVWLVLVAVSSTAILVLLLAKMAGNSFASYTLLLTKKAPPYILRVEVTRRRGGARMIYELE